MMADMWGPLSLRRSDLWLLRESKLNERLAACQAHLAVANQKYGSMEIQYFHGDLTCIQIIRVVILQIVKERKIGE